MYSSTDRSADVLEVGDNDGDCTISCKQDGRRPNIPPANSNVTSRSILLRHAGSVLARADGAETPSYPDPVGTYCSAGYGTLVLCNMLSTSPACKGIQNDVRAITGSESLTPNPHDLFTYWGAVWEKHGYFAYTNGSSYSLLVGRIYRPRGEGEMRNGTRGLIPGVRLDTRAIIQK